MFHPEASSFEQCIDRGPHAGPDVTTVNVEARREPGIEVEAAPCAVADMVAEVEVGQAPNALEGRSS